MKLRALAVLFCFVALSCHTLAALAQERQGANDTFQPDEKLVQAVTKAKIVTTGYPVHVLRNGNEVMVTTLENPKATVRSTKIDAVLCAKAIMDAEKNVLIVHYRLKKQMSDKTFKVITVRQSDVMAYGVSAINVNNLLGQLKIYHRTPKRFGGH